MANRSRDAGREGFWRATLKRQAASGLSVRAFCRQHNLAESNFYAWRRTIAERDQEHRTIAPRDQQQDAINRRERRTLGARQKQSRPKQPSQKQSRPKQRGVAASVNGKKKWSKSVPAFVPLAVKGRLEPEAPIVLELRGGRRLHLSESIEPQRLAAIVHALEAEAVS